MYENKLSFIKIEMQPRNEKRKLTSSSQQHYRRQTRNLVMAVVVKEGGKIERKKWKKTPTLTRSLFLKQLPVDLLERLASSSNQ